MSKPTGGPAFPNTLDNSARRGGARGMSLRDWFAGMAMIQMIPPASVKSWEAEVAQNAYRIADAMLAERER